MFFFSLIFFLSNWLNFNENFYIFRNFDSAKGLPQNTVNALLQTGDGYIWIGTQEGLSRFNGTEFKNFDKNVFPSLKNFHVLCLLEDSKGNLWIGTFRDGLFLYKESNFIKIGEKTDLKEGIIRFLYEDRKGDIWIGTEGNGLWKLKGEEIFQIKILEKKPGLSIRTIREDSMGRIWIGTEGEGIFVLKKEKFEKFEKINVGNVYSIYEDSRKNIWIGTEEGLFKYFNENLISYKNKIEDNFIRCLYEDKDKILWIGTNSAGLYALKEEKFYKFGVIEKVLDNNILSIMQDKEGSLWVGTRANGICQLAERKVYVYTTKDGLSNDAVWAVMEGKEGEIWIGTSGGLSLLKEGKFYNFGKKEGILTDIVGSLAIDEKGVLWVGTNGGGFYKFEKNKFFLFDTKSGLINNTVSAIAVDGEGGIYLGTRGGLSYFKKGKFKNYTIKDGLPGEVIHCLLYEDPGLWIGTRDGLCFFEKGNFRVYTTKDGLSNNLILSLYKDEDENLWIGTYGGGLNLLKDGKFFSITIKDGLFDDTIFQILEDKKGFLWMSSNKGIFNISKREIFDFLNSKIKKINCKSFGISDGMITQECNGGSQPAGCILKSGNLIFPTNKGLVLIDPDRIKINNILPNVKIESILINGKEIDLKKENSLGPGKLNLEFHYSALSFIAPEKVYFKYKLDGYDNEWIFADTRRVAYYTNLLPGKYVFRVIACNNDGFWNDEGAYFSFSIKPFFYQTLFFKIFSIFIVLFFAGMIFFVFYRQRMAVVKAERSILAEKNRLAQEIHDSIAQGLQGLIILLQIAEKNFKESNQIRKALWLARETLQEARHSIYNLQSSNFEITSFFDLIKAKIDPLFNETQIKINYNLTGKPQKLSPLVEFNLLRIIQEAVRNSIKHSGATIVEINLNYQKDKLYVSVVDNGKGFNVEEKKIKEESGFGIFNMQDRAKNIGADFKIESKIGGGTKIQIELKLKEDEG